MATMTDYRYVTTFARQIHPGDLVLDSTGCIVLVERVEFTRGGDVVEIHFENGFNKVPASTLMPSWRDR